MTLEAAVVLPFVAVFFVTILFWFRVLEVETEVYTALCYASRRTAASATISGHEMAELALAEGYFQYKLSEAEHAGKYLSSTQKVLMLAESATEGDYVDLVAVYRMKLPIAFFSVKEISIRQESKSRKWIGSNAADVDEEYVYVTEQGTVYHLTKECKYLELSIRQENAAALDTLRNLDGHKYYACERCVAKSSEKTILYVTDYGTVYHESLTCSGLKRSVYVVRKTEAGDKKLCSKCGKNKNQ